MGNCNCSCSKETKLIFPCSGAADVGELADKSARKATKDGIGSMYCLAGIGGSVSGIIASTKSADKVVAIDGCPLDCAKRTLEKEGFTKFEHIRITDLGFEKGKTNIDNENLNKVFKEIDQALTC